MSHGWGVGLTHENPRYAPGNQLQIGVRCMYYAASPQEFFPANNCNDPLASTTSFLAQFRTHFALILLITSYTSIGLTAPSP